MTALFYYQFLIKSKVMKIEKSYKYRIYPNKKQKEIIVKTFGCCRFVYNKYLTKRIEMYEQNKETFSYVQCANDMKQLKAELDWLKEVDSTALQSSLKDLDNAYQKFFKEHAGYPKFKSKKTHSFSYKSKYSHKNIKYCGKYIKLPKLGMVKTKNNLIPQGRILNATISQEPNGHYYCSLCCTNIEFSQYERTGKTVGIDLGIVDFAIFSDGIKIENPRFYEKSEKKLAKLQRELSRKTIGSSNWNKTRIKVANLQKHISNQRNDFLHKLTTDIVRQYDVICLEDLDVKSMKETDSKTRNKHMNDVSLSEFRRQITYKSQWCGKVISVIDRYYPSSQICHICGHRDGKKSVDIRKWICPNCHSELDRDENAAINIENEGLRVLEMT
jgi:putative transposase